jgi:hypothetical protein
MFEFQREDDQEKFNSIDAKVQKLRQINSTVFLGYVTA